MAITTVQAPSSNLLTTITSVSFPEWLCFSIHSHSDDTIDFACESYQQLKTWVLGLSALVGQPLDEG